MLRLFDQMEFNKDIISIFFEIFEEQQDEETLNSLSLVCKLFNRIDQERKSHYKKYFEILGLKPYFERCDNYLLKKYSSIVLDMNKYYKENCIDSKTFLEVFPDTLYNLRELKVNNMKELLDLSFEDYIQRLFIKKCYHTLENLKTVRRNTDSGIPNYHIVFECMNDSDPVKTIMNLHLIFRDYDWFD